MAKRREYNFQLGGARGNRRINTVGHSSTETEVLKPAEIVTVKKQNRHGLHCPVCMSILKKKVVMTCLHRFCEECIDKVEDEQ